MYFNTDTIVVGKTLTMLSLIIATKKDTSEHFSNTTLIGRVNGFILKEITCFLSLFSLVVPLSVLSNWKTQISDHFTSNSLTYHVYYETGRNLLSEQLKNYDIVITTYQVVAQDFAAKSNVVTKADVNGNVKKKQKTKTKTGLFDVKWKVIDRKILLGLSKILSDPWISASFLTKGTLSEIRKQKQP